MLKRINVHHLTVGMYLHELCGSWMEHPFWRLQFLLKDPADLVRIRATDISEVWIDTSRGADVAAGITATTMEEANAQVDTTFHWLEETPTPKISPILSTPPPLPARSTRRSRLPTSMNVELHEAASICEQGKTAMVLMLNEARMGNAVDTSQVTHLVEEISDSVMRNPGALISLARLKTADDYSYMHSVAVCALMVALSREIHLDEESTRSAGMAGLLHDLGKAMIPLCILNKPGKLTDEEFAIVRNHPTDGHKILKKSKMEDHAVLDACLHHHEKMDGSGYPDRLPGDQISLIAKMAAICDVYDAITSNRPYKSGWDPAESLRRMAQWTGHFDTKLFHAFVKSIGIYPSGSLVRLTSGHIGVVMEQSATRLTLPKVKVFYSTQSHKRFSPEIIDLAAPECTEKIVAREDPEQWKFSDLNVLWTGMPDQMIGL